MTGGALLALVSHGAARAQATADAGEDAIVVTGFRAQNRLAVEAKRDSDIIAEFLKSDDIGQQPDYNIADSFRRLPGVQTVFDEDEGRYVSIRGLNPSFTIGSFDGATMATAERGNRQLNMEAIPSTAVASLEVLKSRTPDIEGNAIGGSINLVTRSAFDKPGTFLIGNAFLGISDSQAIPGTGFGRSSDDGLNFRADGTFSTRFGPDGNYGIVLTGSFSRKRRDQERLLPQAVPTTTGTTPAPAGANTNLLWSTYPNSVDRYGGTAKFEARPAPGLEASIAYTYFSQDDTEIRHSQQLLNTAGGSFVRFNDFPIRKPLHVGQGKINYDSDNGHHFALRGSYSQATFLEPSNQVRFNLIGAAPTFDLELDGPYPVATNIDPRFDDPAQYRFALYDPYEDNSTDKVTEGQFDYGWNNQRGDEGFGIGAGAKYRKTVRDNDRTQDIYAPATGIDLRLSQFNQAENYQPIFGNFNHLFVDFQGFLDYFNANPGVFVRNARDSDRQNIGGDWRFEEKVSAGYGLLRHKGERHTIIVGARYEKTEVAATSVSRATVAGADVFTPITRTNNYDDFLPSITGLYDLTDNVRLRAAWFKAVGRPNPNQISGQELINADDSISRPNFALQPRRGDSYEASFEYYMPEGLGIIALGVFHKKIRDEIYTFSTIETIDGVQRNVSQPRNAESAKVTGFEANVILNRLDFLPGFLSNFGVSGNMTFLDGRIVIRDQTTRRPLDQLPGQAEFLANAAVFYEQGPVRARVSYSHVGALLSSVNASNPAADQTAAAFDTFDGQIRIKANSAIEIIGEVRNLTNAERLTFTGPNQDIARDINRFGRQFWIGAAFTL
ncbi:TonB-dependent receptor [Polymorphobacter sp.]|uniref:TonB-dependent receptor n=1 Tax=Polymorphobacter sp. TaxID=1909290 RepID=UPI003F716262